MTRPLPPSVNLERVEGWQRNRISPLPLPSTPQTQTPVNPNTPRFSEEITVTRPLPPSVNLERVEGWQRNRTSPPPLPSTPQNQTPVLTEATPPRQPQTQDRTPADSDAPLSSVPLAEDDSQIVALRQIFFDKNCPGKPLPEGIKTPTGIRGVPCDACQTEVSNWYSQHSIWKDNTNDERAAEAMRLFENKFSELTNNNQITNKTPRSVFVCIMKPESSVSMASKSQNGFYPETVNYSFCNGNNRWRSGRSISSAFGLGGMTLNAFRDVGTKMGLWQGAWNRNENTKNHTRLLHESLATRPDLQAESSIRYLDLMYTQRGATSWEQAVAEYDQDSRSRYLDILRRCKTCYEAATDMNAKIRCLTR